MTIGDLGILLEIIGFGLMLRVLTEYFVRKCDIAFNHNVKRALRWRWLDNYLHKLAIPIIIFGLILQFEWLSKLLDIK